MQSARSALQTMIVHLGPLVDGETRAMLPETTELQKI